MTVADRIRRHRLATFFGLTFLVSWLPWPLWAAGLVPSAMFFFGPLVAAVVVIGVTDGVAGYRELGSRLIRWRVGWRWWAAAIGLPLAVLALATAANVTIWDGPAPDLAAMAWGEIALLVAMRFVVPLDGPIGEEPGWRGYALPHLQRRFSPLVAAGVLGVLVAGWHLPLVVLGSLSWVGLPGTVAITFVYVWLFDHTDGSLLLALLFHASQGAFTFGMLGLPAADAERAAAVYTGVLIVVVAGLVALDRRAWRSAPASAVEAEHGHERVPAGPSVAG
jgi:membrane protease YdiL (CAAX protease family)